MCDVRVLIFFKDFDSMGDQKYPSRVILDLINDIKHLSQGAVL